MTRVGGDWLTRPETQAVLSMLTDAGAQALAVGGCVRNALLGAPVSDVDIATDARPERVVALAGAAGLKAVPTGIEHGTVTVVSGGIAHEVTTFRRDIETDGRHAVVTFSGDVGEDAARRDFTMNALYCHADGRLVDPLGGLPDLMARRVRFIGRADDRIAEDYLRSLRFFRFHAWYGDAAEGFDAEALDAIGRNLDGLERLSRERVGAELRKLLAAPDPSQAVAGMRITGVLMRLLPGAEDRALGPLLLAEHTLGLSSDPIRRLAVLGGEDVADRLRLSRAETRKLERLRDLAGAMMPPAEAGYRHGRAMALDMMALRAAIAEAPPDPGVITDIEKGASANFPVNAADLMPRYEGPALGARLEELKARWIASGFALSRDALLADGV